MTLKNKFLSALKDRTLNQSFWLELMAILILLCSFTPIYLWFAQNTVSEARLFHSLITLIIAVLLLFLSERPEIEPVLCLNKESKKSFLISFGLLAAHFICDLLKHNESINGALFYWAHNLFLIASMAFAVAGLIFYILGTRISRITYSSTIAFTLFLLISLYIGYLDWPLRTLAAQWSTHIFDLLGQSTQVFLISPEGNAPQIIIKYAGENFNVASECNGFGIILNSLLISLLLSAYRRATFSHSITNIIAALFLGFSFNILRIITIILFAPSFMDYYNFIHELIGTAYYWGAFYFTWYLLRGPFFEPKEG